MTADSKTQPPRGSGFLLGFMTGALVAAAVAMWLTPQSAPLRRRVKDSLKDLGKLGEDVEKAGRSAVAEIKTHLPA